ncbi:PolC-type DNA polymerase III [Pontiella sp.]|uniref:3'-5' exonuclease n=1 Tax=Pontiella sp. TaxID=2837462 RepID=UPI00356362A3
MKKFIYAILLLLSAAATASVSNVVFVAFDVETTGFSPDSDRIIEIGAVKSRNGEILETAQWLINPGIPIRNFDVHGITDEQVAESPAFAEAYRAFKAFAGDGVLIAHNASFDVRFMAAEIKRNELKPIPNATLNSLTLFRRWYPAAPSHKLGELATELGIPVATEHRARDDAETLLNILAHGLKRHPEATLEQIRATANGTYHFDGSHRQ